MHAGIFPCLRQPIVIDRCLVSGRCIPLFPLFLRVRTHTHALTHARARARTHTHTHAHAHAHARTHTHTCTMMILLLALTLKLRMAPAASSCSLLSGERSRSTSGGSAPSSTILTSFWSLTDTLRTTTAACSCSVVKRKVSTRVCLRLQGLLPCSLRKPVHTLSRLFHTKVVPTARLQRTSERQRETLVTCSVLSGERSSDTM